MYGKPEERQPEPAGSRGAEHGDGQEYVGTDRANDRRCAVQGRAAAPAQCVPPAQSGSTHRHRGLRRHRAGAERYGKAEHKNGHRHQDPDRQIHPQSGRNAHAGQRHGGGGLRKGPEGLSQCRARRKAPCPKAAGVSGGQPGKAGAVLVKENPLRLTLFASSPEGRAIGKTENVSGMSKAPPFGGAGNAKH